MNRQAERWSCGDQEDRTGRKLEVPETRMKGQAGSWRFWKIG